MKTVRSLANQVTPERFRKVKHAISIADRVQLLSLIIIGLVLLSSFPWEINQSVFVAWVLLVLCFAMAASTFFWRGADPTEKDLRRSLVSTGVAVIAGLVAVGTAFWFSTSVVTIAAFLVGPVMLGPVYFLRRIPVDDIHAREIRGITVGQFGNLRGMQVGIRPFGVNSSTGFDVRTVVVATVVGILLAVYGFLRAHVLQGARASDYDLTLLTLTVVAGTVAGVSSGVALAFVLARFNRALEGRVVLDTLERNRLWIYYPEGKLASFKMMGRPMVTISAERTAIIGRYPVSFEVKADSQSDFEDLCSILQGKEGYK